MSLAAIVVIAAAVGAHHFRKYLLPVLRWGRDESGRGVEEFR